MSSRRRRASDESRPATRSDVARLAGVSTAVVSFVVNGGPKPVSEATRERVLQAVDQLGYRPNRTARALALGSTNTLGLVGSDTTNPFYAEYTAQLQSAAADLGYAMLMTVGGKGPDAALRAMLDLCDRGVDGLILTRPVNPDHLRELGLRAPQTPVVIIDATTPVSGYSTIGAAATDGMAAAVDHLLQLHHHHTVALVIGDEVEPASDGRENGWRRAHRRHGRHLGELVRAPFTRAGGHLAGLNLLHRPDRPTAIVASSDLQATGILRAADDLNLRVPHDLALVSFDGTEEVAYTTPPLTTARQPTKAMAAAAVDTLIRRPIPFHETIAMDLIIRSSCGCPTSTTTAKASPRAEAPPDPIPAVPGAKDGSDASAVSPDARYS